MSENIPPANTVSNQRLVRKQERTLSIRTVMGDVAEHNVAPRPLLQKLRKVQEKTQNTQNIQNTESTANAELGSKRKRDGSKKINDDEKDEIKNLNGYQKLSKIGEGTYGIVFKALHKSTNKIVALKKVRLTYSEGIPVTAMREIAILKEMHHNNVIGLTDLIQLETCVYLVTDYLEMDMRRYMIEAGRDGLTPQHIKSFMHQLLSGLCYCHSHRILHRDLKPQNLLIDRNGKLTIADLGLSRAFGVPMRTYTHQVITLWYRPPEILLGSRHYSTAVDLWSVGCIFAEMMTMKPVFPGDSQIDELFRIFRLLGTPTEEMWPGVTTLPDYQGMFPVWSRKNLKEAFRRYPGFIELDDYAFNLLEQLLDYDPCYRISAKKALEHPYFYTDITTLKF